MQNADRTATANAAFSDAGFIRAIDPVAARRQFRVSLGLMAILGAATLASAMTLAIPAPQQGVVARATVQAPQIIHVRHAGDLRGHGG